MRGKRAKATSSLPMDSKTPSVVRRRHAASSLGYASSRLRLAMRRRRGIPMSSKRAQRSPSQSASGRGEYSRAAIKARARPDSRALRKADRARNLFDPAAGNDEVIGIEHGGLAR